jgi:hypothetical protein
MFCPNCGAKMGETDRFCTACGTNVPSAAPGEAEEKELYSFGPMGVGICFRRPGLTVPIVRNSTKIVLTNRRIRGSPQASIIPTKLLLFKAQFEVPYDTILATEQFGYLVNKALWIQYRDAEKTKEVSIICSPRISGNISRAYELIQNAKASLR